jgi:hypothetical protein
MPHYRVCVLTDDNQIWGPPIDVTFENDQDAILQTERLVDGNDVELWRGSRLVARIRSADREGVAKPSRPLAGTFFLIGVGSPLRAAVSPPAWHRACRDARLGPFQTWAHATVPRLKIPFDRDLLQSCVSDIYI